MSGFSIVSPIRRPYPRYVTAPEQPLDPESFLPALPNPFRFIAGLTSHILDSAWDEIRWRSKQVGVKNYLAGLPRVGPKAGSEGTAVIDACLRPPPAEGFPVLSPSTRTPRLCSQSLVRFFGAASMGSAKAVQDAFVALGTRAGGVAFLPVPEQLGRGLPGQQPGQAPFADLFHRGGLEAGASLDSGALSTLLGPGPAPTFVQAFTALPGQALALQDAAAAGQQAIPSVHVLSAATEVQQAAKRHLWRDALCFAVENGAGEVVLPAGAGEAVPVGTVLPPVSVAPAADHDSTRLPPSLTVAPPAPTPGPGENAASAGGAAGGEEEQVNDFRAPPPKALILPTWSSDPRERGVLLVVASTAVAYSLPPPTPDAPSPGHVPIPPTGVVRVFHIPAEVLTRGGGYSVTDPDHGARARAAAAGWAQYDPNASTLSQDQYVPPIRWLASAMLPLGVTVQELQASADGRYFVATGSNADAFVYYLHPAAVQPPPLPPVLSAEVLLLRRQKALLQRYGAELDEDAEAADMLGGGGGEEEEAGEGGSGGEGPPSPSPSLRARVSAMADRTTAATTKRVDLLEETGEHIPPPLDLRPILVVPAPYKRPPPPPPVAAPAPAPEPVPAPAPAGKPGSGKPPAKGKAAAPAPAPPPEPPKPAEPDAAALAAAAAAAAPPLPLRVSLAFLAVLLRSPAGNAYDPFYKEPELGGGGGGDDSAAVIGSGSSVLTGGDDARSVTSDASSPSRARSRASSREPQPILTGNARRTSVAGSMRSSDGRRSTLGSRLSGRTGRGGSSSVLSGGSGTSGVSGGKKGPPPPPRLPPNDPARAGVPLTIGLVVTWAPAEAGVALPGPPQLQRFVLRTTETLERLSCAPFAVTFANHDDSASLGGVALSSAAALTSPAFDPAYVGPSFSRVALSHPLQAMASFPSAAAYDASLFQGGATSPYLHAPLLVGGDGVGVVTAWDVPPTPPATPAGPTGAVAVAEQWYHRKLGQHSAIRVADDAAVTAVAVSHDGAWVGSGTAGGETGCYDVRGAGTAAARRGLLARLTPEADPGHNRIGLVSGAVLGLGSSASGPTTTGASVPSLATGLPVAAGANWEVALFCPPKAATPHPAHALNGAHWLRWDGTGRVTGLRFLHASTAVTDNSSEAAPPPVVLVVEAVDTLPVGLGGAAAPATTAPKPLWLGVDCGVGRLLSVCRLSAPLPGGQEPDSDGLFLELEVAPAPPAVPAGEATAEPAPVAPLPSTPFAGVKAVAPSATACGVSISSSEVILFSKGRGAGGAVRLHTGMGLQVGSLIGKGYPSIGRVCRRLIGASMFGIGLPGAANDSGDEGGSIGGGSIGNGGDSPVPDAGTAAPEEAEVPLPEPMPPAAERLLATLAVCAYQCMLPATLGAKHWFGALRSRAPLASPMPAAEGEVMAALRGATAMPLVRRLLAPPVGAWGGGAGGAGSPDGGAKRGILVRGGGGRRSPQTRAGPKFAGVDGKRAGDTKTSFAAALTGGGNDARPGTLLFASAPSVATFDSEASLFSLLGGGGGGGLEGDRPPTGTAGRRASPSPTGRGLTSPTSPTSPSRGGGAGLKSPLRNLRPEPYDGRGDIFATIFNTEVQATAATTVPVVAVGATNTAAPSRRSSAAVAATAGATKGKAPDAAPAPAVAPPPRRFAVPSELTPSPAAALDPVSLAVLYEVGRREGSFPRRLRLAGDMAALSAQLKAADPGATKKGRRGSML